MRRWPTAAARHEQRNILRLVGRPRAPCCAPSTIGAEKNAASIDVEGCCVLCRIWFVVGVGTGGFLPLSSLLLSFGMLSSCSLPRFPSVFFFSSFRVPSVCWRLISKKYGGDLVFDRNKVKNLGKINLPTRGKNRCWNMMMSPICLSLRCVIALGASIVLG